MDKWRNPLKWIEITNFALVTLSAIGVQHLMTSLDPANLPDLKIVRRRIAWFGGIMVALAGAGLDVQLISSPWCSGPRCKMRATISSRS